MPLLIIHRKAEKNACLPAKAGMLDLFEKNGVCDNKSNFRFQFWEHEDHPILLASIGKFQQRFIYLHENPVERHLQEYRKIGFTVVRSIVILRAKSYWI